MRIAGISGNEFTVFCFAWVGCIVEPRREGLQGGFAFVDVHGDDSSDSDRQDSFLKKQMVFHPLMWYTQTSSTNRDAGRQHEITI